MTIRFDTGHYAATGARKHQEDACAFAVLVAALARYGPSGALEGEDAVLSLVAVLADGMGGHVGGERASTLACSGFVEAYREDDGLSAEDRLVKALEKANEAIAEEVRAEPSLDGMGCTLVAASLDAGGLRWISVGDSHLFLYRRGELFLLNENHSLAPVLDRLAEEGQMSSQDALNHPRRHYLRSALTGEDIELVDLFSEGFPLKTGDWIILASDGIDTLPPEQISEIIERNAQHPAEKVATELVNATLAVDLPLQDNTTVMAISVHSR